jgi:hypothetical protein
MRKGWRGCGWAAAGLTLALALPASARPAASCAGAVLAGAAQLLCSHVNPKAPPQFCTFKWELATTANMPQLVQGAVTLPPGASNVQVYQGSGFARAIAPPIVLCQGRKGVP